MHPMKSVSILLFVSTATAAFASSSFQDYQIILDRSPFGEAPSRSSQQSTRPATPPTPTDYRLSALFEGVDGQIRAGLVNKKTNKSLTLQLEVSEEGILLVDADFDTNSATITEQGRTFILELTAGPSSIPAGIEPSSRTDRFADRRRSLLAKMSTKTPAEESQPRLTGEELKAHLQSYQMEVIRNGMPPLPIPLTAEMDDQLVAEGVLDAVE